MSDYATSMKSGTHISKSSKTRQEKPAFMAFSQPPVSHRYTEEEEPAKMKSFELPSLKRSHEVPAFKQSSHTINSNENSIKVSLNDDLSVPGPQTLFDVVKPEHSNSFAPSNVQS